MCDGISESKLVGWLVAVDVLIVTVCYSTTSSDSTCHTGENRDTHFNSI